MNTGRRTLAALTAALIITAVAACSEADTPEAATTTAAPTTRGSGAPEPKAGDGSVVSKFAGSPWLLGDVPERATPADSSKPPIKVGFPVIDVAVGMLGALSVSAALQRRARTGEGQHIDASMVQASLMLMYPNASNFLTNRVEPPRAGRSMLCSSSACAIVRSRKACEFSHENYID